MGNKPLAKESIYFHLPHYHHINSMGPAGAIRKRDYKLIEVFETGKYELYNVRKDIGENHDLATKMPKLAKNLAKSWRFGEKNPTPVWRKSIKITTRHSITEKKEINSSSGKPGIFTKLRLPLSKKAFFPPSLLPTSNREESHFQQVPVCPTAHLARH